MLIHLMKMIYNRKTANLLIIIEVIVTFVVLFALICGGRYLYQNYHQPLGFSWQNTWSVVVDFNQPWDNAKQGPEFTRLVEVLRQQPQIDTVSWSGGPILQSSEWTSSTEVNGRQLLFNVLRVSDNAAKDWGVELTAGRWFGRQDDGQNYQAILVNQLFVDEMFAGRVRRNPIGFEIPYNDAVTKPRRIVGVYKHFRQRGEFSKPVPYVFYRYPLDAGHIGRMSYVHLTFKQAPSAAYEKQLQQVMKAAAPQWQFTVRSWASLRQTMLNTVLIPLTIVSVIVGFLVVMVAMGLLGVLWQNIHQRTREIGLRRACGASASAIQWQIIGELVTLALFSMAIASVLLVQVPLLSLVEIVTWGNFLFSLATAAGVILIVVVLCALYPSRVAIKMAPALALHYD